MPSRPAVLRLLTGLAVIATIGLLTLVAWWSTLPLRDAVIERAHRETQLEALSLSEQLSAVARSAISSLNAVTQSIQERGGPRQLPAAELRTELQRAAGDEVGTQAMFVVDAEGKVVASVGFPQTHEGRSLLDRPTIAYHFPHPTELRIRVGRAHYSELTGGWILPVSRIIASPEGKMLGVVSVGSASDMRALYEQMENLREASLSIWWRRRDHLSLSLRRARRRLQAARRAFVLRTHRHLRSGEPDRRHHADPRYRQLDLDAVTPVGFPRTRRRPATMLLELGDLDHPAEPGARGAARRALAACKRQRPQLADDEVVTSTRYCAKPPSKQGHRAFLRGALAERERAAQPSAGPAAIRRRPGRHGCAGRRPARCPRLDDPDGGLAEDLRALALARDRALKREDLDLSSLAHAVARSQQAGDPGRTVEFRIQARMYTTADAPLLKVVLANLIGTPGNSRETVRAPWSRSGRTRG